MVTVTCPACERALEVEDEYRDWTVRCPHCGAEFVPDDVTGGPPVPPPARPRRPRRPRDDDDYDDEEYDDRDRRSARADARARELVAAPAMWLGICGWLSAVGTIGIVALCFLMAAAMANNPQANQNDEPAEMFVFIGCCMGVFGLPYGIVMALGARHMGNLSSRGWAMTAAILGIASIAVFGVLGVVPTGIGVWALVTLDKPAVRAAFERRR